MADYGVNINFKVVGMSKVDRATAKAKKLEEALKSIDLDKSVSTEVINDKVVVKINNEESKDIQDVVSKTITAIEDARNKSGNYDTDVLIGGINDGTIDIIASHHEPQDIDTKKCEFEKANFGVISLQTFFSNIVQLSRRIPLENLIKTFSTNPKKILGVETYSVVEGSKASFTVFDPDGSWDYNENSNLSKSINSPWLNWSLKGKVKAVIKDNRIKEIN